MVVTVPAERENRFTGIEPALPVKLVAESTMFQPAAVPRVSSAVTVSAPVSGAESVKLYAIEPNFPPGKTPPDPRFASTYFDMSKGDESNRGPWNKGEDWQFVTDMLDKAPVGDGDGSASVGLNSEEQDILQKNMARTKSNPDAHPMTGVDLGSRDQHH